MWYDHLVDDIKIPLVNADRMMLSILPEPGRDGRLRSWAQKLRDTDEMWMAVAQKGVQSFVAQAMAKKVPFAMETFCAGERAEGSTFGESRKRVACCA